MPWVKLTQTQMQTHTHAHTQTDRQADTHTHSLPFQHQGKFRENQTGQIVVMAIFQGELSHGFHVGHPEVLKGGADRARRGRGLAAGTHGVQLGAQGQVEDDIVLMAANDAIEVQLELCEVKISRCQGKLGGEGHTTIK